MKPIAEALTDLSPEVRAELLRPVEIRDPRNAEIVPGKEPKWFVVEVYASQQSDVAAQFAEHRFGVYIPELDETVVRRGRKLDRRVPLFSGYIFVFMWPCDEHWRWLADTAGVVAIVGSLTDAEIDIIRRVENQMRPLTIDIEPVVDEIPQIKRSKSKKKRRWKNRRSVKAKTKQRPITEADLRAEIITTRAWSAFDDIQDLDSEGRNQTLMRALGLS